PARFTMLDPPALLRRESTDAIDTIDRIADAAFASANPRALRLGAAAGDKPDGRARRTPPATIPGSCTRYDVNSVGMLKRSPRLRISSSISLEPPLLRFSAASQPIRCLVQSPATNGCSRSRSGKSTVDA